MADRYIEGRIPGGPTGEGLALPYDHRLKVKMNIFRMDVKKFLQSLTSIDDPNSFYRLATQHLTVALIDWCYEVLYMAVEGCPYDTGALRSSGTVDLVLGAGERILDNVITTQADSDGNFDIRVHHKSIKRAASKVGAYIYFDRSDKGMDVALWAHELLLPAKNRPSKKERKAMGKRVWYAVHKGTGPKYLENAVNRYRRGFNDRMQQAIYKAVKAYNAKHGQKVRSR